MSHVSRTTVEIKNAKKEVLDEALKLMLQHEAEIERVNERVDYYGNRNTIKGFGLKQATSRYGVDVVVNRGQIQLVCESMDRGNRALSKKVKRYYNAVASMRQLNSMGYRVSGIQVEKNKIKLVGLGR